MNKLILIVLLNVVAVQAQPTISEALKADQQAQQQQVSDVKIQDAKKQPEQGQSTYYGSRWVRAAAGVVTVVGVCAWALYEYAQDMANRMSVSPAQKSKKQRKEKNPDSIIEEPRDEDDENDC